MEPAPGRPEQLAVAHETTTGGLDAPGEWFVRVVHGQSTTDDGLSSATTLSLDQQTGFTAVAASPTTYGMSDIWGTGGTMSTATSDFGTTSDLTDARREAEAVTVAHSRCWPFAFPSWAARLWSSSRVKPVAGPV